jgi:serine/threonine protein phosphatase PrpC
MDQPETAAAQPKNTKRKDAAKASVMFGRQGDTRINRRATVGVEKPVEQSSCCAPLQKIYEQLLGVPDPNKPAPVYYGETKELKNLMPVRQFKDAPEELKVGLQMTTNTGAKEQDGWVNQDNFAGHILPDAGDGKRRFFFGLFDGHGKVGHEVSALIASRLASHLVMSPSLDDVPGAFSEAVTNVDNDVYANLGSDVEYSGSTCVCCLVDWTSRLLHTSNVGDSRAILGRQNDDGTWEAIPLSIDQRPDLDGERERIEAAGGIVSPFLINGVCEGPHRVWDSKRLEKPGLACARSIGDGAARQIGVTPDPEVSSRKLEPQDKFILLCSDGVWDSLSNREVVDILKPYLHLPSIGTKALIEAVRRAEGGALTDDTTMVLVVFKH